MNHLAKGLSMFLIRQGASDLKRFCCILLVFSVVSIGSMSTIFAQESNSGAKVSLPTKDQRSPAATFEISIVPSDGESPEVTLKVEATIADGWHIYPMSDTGLNVPTEIKFEGSGIEPIDSEFKFDGRPGTKELEGTFSWSRRYKVVDDSKPYSGTGSIRFQACDATKCLPPKTLRFTLATPPAESKPTKGSDDGEVIKLATQECSATRPPAKFNASSLFAGRRDDQLHRKCSIEVDGKMIDIYLPKEDSYTTENSSPDNTMVSNTSTYISIDQNGDGILSDHEAQPTNLPIRILDSMYRVAAIAEDASSISMVKTDGPLFGTVLNRKCPEFSFQTIDGSRTISNETILGKVTLLDIWAVT